MLSKFICQMRKKHSLSQDFVAKSLDISRPTYLQIEKGEREITLKEAQKLANVFDLEFNDFIDGKERKIIVDFEKEQKVAKEEKPDLRISVPHLKKEKFKEVLLYILAKVGGRPNIGETTIYKLLYFIDFDYYEKFEEQLIGATYIKNHYGPTPVEFKKIIDEMIKNKEIEKIKSKYFSHQQTKYLPLRDPDLTKLKDARELQHIDDILMRLGDKNASDLSNYSHQDVPWIIAKEKEPIEYNAVFYRTEKTSVREYNEDH